MTADLIARLRAGTVTPADLDAAANALDISQDLAQALRFLADQTAKRANDLGGYDNRFPLRVAIGNASAAVAEWEALQ